MFLAAVSALQREEAIVIASPQPITVTEDARREQSKEFCFDAFDQAGQGIEPVEREQNCKSSCTKHVCSGCRFDAVCHHGLCGDFLDRAVEKSAPAATKGR